MSFSGPGARQPMDRHAGVERFHAEHGVCPAPQPACDRVSCRCCAMCCGSTSCATRHCAKRNAETRADATAGQVSWNSTDFTDEFRDWYFLPMLGCIWSCPTDQMLQFPVATMIRFCHNHGPDPGEQPAAVVDRDRAGHASTLRRSWPHIADKRLEHPRAIASPATHRAYRDPRRRPEPNASTRWYWPATRDQSLRAAGTTASRPNSKRSGPFATSPTAPCCTPTPRYCPEQRRAWAAWNYERAARHERDTGPGLPALPDQHAAAGALSRSRWWCRSNPVREIATEPCALAVLTTPTRCLI